MTTEELFQIISELEPSAKQSEKTSDRPTVETPAETLVSLMQKLKDDSRLSFNMLLAHTAVDWLEEGQFELVYQLYSPQNQQYLAVLVYIPRNNPVIPTISSIWRIAEWQEREVYDLFGVLYDNHPDLRRLFLEDDWTGFPLRKSYQDDFILERPK